MNQTQDEQVVNVARDLLDRGSYGEGEALLKKHIQSLQVLSQGSSSTSTTKDISYSYQLLGYSAVLQGQYEDAKDHYLKAIKLAESIQDELRMAAAYSGLGVTFYNQSDFPTALSWFTKSLELNEKHSFANGIASDCGNLGNIHYKLEDYDRAAEHFERCVRMYEQQGLVLAAANSYGSIALCHQKKGNLSLAKQLLEKSAELLKDAGNLNFLARQLGNLGTVYYQMGLQEESLSSMQKALELHEQMGNKHGIAMWTSNIGFLHAQPSFFAFDPELAERLIREALAMHEAMGSKSEVANTYDSLSTLFENTGRYKEALEAYKVHHRILEEVHSIEAREAAERHDSEFKLATERARVQATEQVLHRVLPASIAERLTRGEEVADHFENISVFFSDIVGFTPMAARMTAHNVIVLLNYVFATFDHIMAKHGCEKIKTIGDGYMAVSGAPIPCDDHAERMARAALEIVQQKELPDNIKAIIPEGSSFQFRVGLHCGPAFAGIVGENRFVYDVYSDTINTAARMESHGKPGLVHCSVDFQRQLQSRTSSFVFEDRGEMEVKGKGMMATSFLLAEVAN